MTKTILTTKDALDTWLVDPSATLRFQGAGLGLLARIKALLVPTFVSTEQAMEWGSHLNAQQHATLVDIQRTSNNAALAEPERFRGPVPSARGTELIL